MRKVRKESLYLYIHIPFCYRKCPYCSFFSVKREKSTMEAYLKRLKEEIESFKTRKKIQTIYFGGGTPSLLKPEEIASIMDTIHRNFTVSEEAEVTIETNPTDARIDKLREFKNRGINRLSLGVQSFIQRKLTALERIHDAHQSCTAIENALNAGFSNVSIDIIYGLKEDAYELEYEIKQAFNFNIKHISTYMLSVEKKTPFYLMAKEGKVPLSDDSELADQYLTIARLIEHYGFRHYEISNFSKEGYESKHNTAYWLGYEYRGFGVNASSFINGIRFRNPATLAGYLKKKAPTVEERLTRMDLAKEMFMLNLRLTEGVNIKGFKERFGVDPLTLYGNRLKRLIDEGWLEENQGYIRLKNRKAILVSNRIFSELI